MGQPHQAFIIAKVKPRGSSEAKYRCIAAYHHQWCYGTLPLRAAARVLRAVRQPQNAEIIREELRDIDGRYGRFNQAPRIPAMPCQFIALLLGDNWDIDLTPEMNYVSGVSFENSLLHAGDHLWEADNDEGVTIIDVTDPEDPAYCFLKSPEQEPQDAEGYLRHYYKIPARPKVEEIEHPAAPGGANADSTTGDGADTSKAQDNSALHNTLFKFIDDLRDTRVLHAGAIQEAWLDDDEEDEGDENDEDEENASEDTEDEAGKAHEEEHVDTSDEETVEESESGQVEEDVGDARSAADEKATSGIPSLVDITLRQSLKQAIQSGDTSTLEDLPWLQDKMYIVKDILGELSPFPDSAVPLLKTLAKATRHRDTSLDLSGYPLAPQQIISIVDALGDVRSLNLSRNSTLTSVGLKELLAGVPSVTRLVLLSCPSLNNIGVALLVRDIPELFRSLHSLIHPTLMHFPNVKGLPTRMMVLLRGSIGSEWRGVGMPLVAPAVVVQGLTDLLTSVMRDKSGDMDMYGGRALAVAFAGLPRAPDVSWSARTLGMVRGLDGLSLPAGGWMVFVQLGSRYSNRVAPGYAFRRVSPKSRPEVQASGQDPKPTPAAKNASWELHDLHSFLRTTEQEGFPKVSEDAVTALESLMEKMEFPAFTSENAPQIPRAHELYMD